MQVLHLVVQRYASLLSIYPCVVMNFVVHVSPGTQVFVHTLVTEHSLVSRSSEFEAAIQNGERSSLRALCDRKSQESEYVIMVNRESYHFSPLRT